MGNSNLQPRLHYLDGGYIENTGSASMLEVLELLKSKSKYFKEITPIVITLLFSEEDKISPSIRFGNELSEVLNAVTSTRSGNSKINRFKIKQFLDNNGSGFVIDAPLTAKEKTAPMNWVLSAQSIDNISLDIEEKLRNKTNSGIVIKLMRKDLIYYNIKK